MSFAGWNAAIAAGATLDELLKWDSGAYPKQFMARVIAWHNLSAQIRVHTEDAKERAMSRHAASK